MPNDILEALEESLAGLYIPVLGTPFESYGDGVVVGDVHAPYTDWRWAARVALAARKHLQPPRKLFIAGDLFNLDGMSQYEVVVEPPSWATERDAIKAMFSVWLTEFDEIIMVMGNHDRRMQKYTSGAFTTTDMLALINSNVNIRLSNYGWMTLETKRGTYRITHPKNYSINRLTVANDLAAKFKQHIISFHEHHLALGWDRSGDFLIINGGCLVNPYKLPYVNLDDNKSPVMKNGFVMIKDGVPTLFGDEPMTDWSQYE